MTDNVPSPVFWCVVAVALVLAAFLIRIAFTASTRRRRIAELEAAVETRDASLRHLVEARLPLLEQSRPPAPKSLDARLEGTSYALSLHLIEEAFAGAVSRARVRADQSAKAALKGAMRALQGLAHEQQVSISDMQDRHDHPDILGGLLEIDHANAQFGRRAQAIAVLCGSWPGRQRTASSLTDVARGAKSRIRDYRRVQVHAQVETAVVSRAVEPVVLAIAELLDNAARHSQPNTTVEVNIQPAHNGACVVIDDAGVGMNDQEIQQASRWLGGDASVDINRLGDPPQFGFPVVGVLAERYGFRVSIDTRSPYGGVRAVLFLPNALLTHLEPEDGFGVVREVRPAAVSAPAPARPAHARPAHARPETAAPSPAPVLSGPAPAAGDIVGSTVSGLPKRRRRAAGSGSADGTSAPADLGAADAATDEPTDTGARSVHETASRMGAFARGTRSGRAAVQQANGHDADPPAAPAAPGGRPEDSL
ncbi:ATP-binding protein [Yinghuangia sp. ASG 101]|uniref:ATP-binding protein n=1 Tax=Yinghuangia sp. ASG 101 TaxID=2896848 RepID=UPI001E51267F|nr:ATP-binding protein [Yinghuangia sp. ASG 101]UGQ09690.1 ATP-binding protein [Yinghuangia sp. ASG 101]